MLFFHLASPKKAHKYFSSAGRRMFILEESHRKSQALGEMTSYRTICLCPVVTVDGWTWRDAASRMDPFAMGAVLVHLCKSFIAVSISSMLTGAPAVPTSTDTGRGGHGPLVTPGPSCPVSTSTLLCPPCDVRMFHGPSVCWVPLDCDPVSVPGPLSSEACGFMTAFYLCESKIKVSHHTFLLYLIHF